MCLSTHARYACSAFSVRICMTTSTCTLSLSPQFTHDTLSFFALFLPTSARTIVSDHISHQSRLNRFRARLFVTVFLLVFFLLFQSVGQLEINARTIGCDALAAASRKWLRGPRGAGVLYVRDAVLRTEYKLLDMPENVTGYPIEPGSIDHHGAPWQQDKTHASRYHYTYKLRPDARRYVTACI